MKYTYQIVAILCLMTGFFLVASDDKTLKNPEYCNALKRQSYLLYWTMEEPCFDIPLKKGYFRTYSEQGEFCKGLLAHLDESDAKLQQYGERFTLHHELKKKYSNE